MDEDEDNRFKNEKNSFWGVELKISELTTPLLLILWSFFSAFNRYYWKRTNNSFIFCTFHFQRWSMTHCTEGYWFNIIGFLQPSCFCYPLLPLFRCLHKSLLCRSQKLFRSNISFFHFFVWMLQSNGLFLHSALATVRFGRRPKTLRVLLKKY